MDVSEILASHSAKHLSTTVEKEIPLDVDPGFLVVTDTNPIDEESYTAETEAYLLNTARDGVQSLVTKLYSLPSLPSADGLLAQLPAPTTPLPRAKPLPKPKPPTKWERFAAAKGIQKRVREKKVWDEERQEWVERWGRNGKNKEKEEQWITEVPANADVDHDPVKIARDARKARVAKNERQRLQNAARAKPSARDERKAEIEHTLATSRVSTASMGKFDKKLEGEKKLRGVKRKFEPTEASSEQEKKASLALLSRLDSDAKKMRKEPPVAGGEETLNVRKAVHFASKGRGGLALGREASRGNRGKGRGGKTPGGRRGGKR